jgi:excisionase family DNA binding protein
MDDEFISVEEAAKRLGLHPDSIRRFIRKKELKAFRFGGVYRIRKTDFEEFIKTHSTMDEDDEKE